jgi:hypothetical protein
LAKLHIKRTLILTLFFCAVSVHFNMNQPLKISIMACKRQAHGAKTGYALEQASEEPICAEKTGYI